ncbi:MAG: chromosome segregation protein SMC, partial [Pseudomonadales bacterium]
QADEQAQADLDIAEAAQRDDQKRWEEVGQRYNEAMRQVDVQGSRLEHLQQLIERHRQRRQVLAAEEDPSDAHADGRIEELEIVIAQIEEQLAELGAQLEQRRQDITFSQDATRDLERGIEAARGRLQSLRQELTSLEAVQAAALGRDKSKHEAWLVAHGLSQRDRIGENLAVVAGWERAVETVLGAFLHGVVVDDLAAFTDDLVIETASDLALVEATRQPETVESRVGGELPSLASLLRGNGGNLGSLLAGVYAAESLPVAMQARQGLQPGESIITRDGIWMGRDWLTVAPEESAQSGIIRRGRAIETLTVHVEEAETALEEVQQQRELGRERTIALEAERDALQARIATLTANLSERRTELGVYRVQVQEAERRRSRIRQELEELTAQEAEEASRFTSVQELLRTAEARRVEQALAREQLAQARVATEARVAQARQRARTERDAFHAASTELAALRSRHAAVESGLARLTTQIADFARQGEQLQASIEQTRDPLPELRVALEEKLSRRAEVETELGTIRLALEEIDNGVRALEAARHGTEAATEGLRANLEQARIAREGLAVQEANLLERIQSTGRELEAVRAAMPDDASEPAWQENLDRIQRRIERLGAINLAAIDEFRTESERKAYLDAQNDDLEQALATLREAMRKIDRETRARFKETFETVNKRLGELFPKVFGGGHAYLELTGEDLLDTGVSLMARPPGKRNASVHLLSGGEKAMTAIALIFAIFHLNPSPVCLLDEVDAPLDDANVNRYAELIKEMSSEVQFVVITHNKLTMEAADHLLGVTMHEPGVSRLVSVDVGEAVALAAV